MQLFQKRILFKMRMFYKSESKRKLFFRRKQYFNRRMSREKMVTNAKYKLLNEVLIEWNESSEEDSDNVFLKSENINKELQGLIPSKKTISNIIWNSKYLWDYKPERSAKFLPTFRSLQVICKLFGIDIDQVADGKEDFYICIVITSLPELYKKQKENSLYLKKFIFLKRFDKDELKKLTECIYTILKIYEQYSPEKLKDWTTILLPY